MPIEIKGAVLYYFDVPTLAGLSHISRDFFLTINNVKFLENHPKVAKIDKLGQKIFPL